MILWLTMRKSFQNVASNIPDNIARYIDYEGMGRDMELGGDVFTLTTNDGKVHIFWNH